MLDRRVVAPPGASTIKPGAARTRRGEGRGEWRRDAWFRTARAGNIFMTVKESTLIQEAERCEAERVAAERLARARTALPEAAALDLAETFRLLSDPGRLRLIAALLEADELCVCDLAEATGLSPTACSHNLRLLRAQRLVRYRKRGRNVYYTLDDDHIRVLLAVALEHVTH